jgi:hypothetical protein
VKRVGPAPIRTVHIETEIEIQHQSLDHADDLVLGAGGGARDRPCELRSIRPCRTSKSNDGRWADFTAIWRGQRTVEAPPPV